MFISFRSWDRRLLLASCLFLIATSTAWGQGTTTPPVPDGDFVPVDKPAPAKGQAPLIPASAFAMPDVPDDWNKKTTYDGRALSTRFSFVTLVDYSAFSQDADSVSQVGKQMDQWDLRTQRLASSGQLKFAHPVDYFVSLEIKGQDHVQSGSSAIGFTDWYIGTALGRIAKIKYGKIKEPFVYEMVGDAANLPQQERMLSPFFVSRGTGVRAENTFAKDRMKWSLGWFNGWWVDGEPFKKTANDVAGRLTGLPYRSTTGDSYLHLGVSVRYVGDSDDQLRFRGRPESNTAAYYVDTGTIAAGHAIETGVEVLWTRGPFSITSDYAGARVDSPATGDPRFWGAYATVSYVLTGEHRPYATDVGYARRILPQYHWGAWEIVGRYSYVDLDDAQVPGGKMDKTTAGLNWWATRRWKFGVDYGMTDLDRFDVRGRTKAVHTRVQWIY